MDVIFPVEWRFGENPTDGIGGPAVDDAGTVYIVRDEEKDEDWPDGNYDASMLVKKTSLAEMVNYCMEGWQTHDGSTGDIHVAASDALAAALRAAADMLDARKRPTQFRAQTMPEKTCNTCKHRQSGYCESEKLGEDWGQSDNEQGAEGDLERVGCVQHVAIVLLVNNGYMVSKTLPDA